MRARRSGKAAGEDGVTSEVLKIFHGAGADLPSIAAEGQPSSPRSLAVAGVACCRASQEARRRKQLQRFPRHQSWARGGEDIPHLRLAQNASVLEKHALDTQCAGIGGKGCDIAHLTVTAFTEAATAAKQSAAILDLDISNAFGSAARELVFRTGRAADTVARGLAALGMCTHDVEAVCGNLCQGYCHDELGTSQHVAEMLGGIHQGMWASVDGLAQIIVTLRSCRAGGPAGRRCLRPPDAQGADGNQAAPVCWWSAHSRGDVPYADDTALLLWNDSPTELVKQVQTTCWIALMCFRVLGLRLNFNAGKSEAVLCLAGRGHPAIRQQIFHGWGGGIPIADESGVPSVSLRVVHQYKHVGTTATSTGTMLPESCARSKAARVAGIQLRPLLRRKAIPEERRLELAVTFIESRLFYNAATWPILSTYCFRRLEAPGMHALRAVTANAWKPGAAIPNNTAVLSGKGLLAVGEHLRLLRLRFLGRLLRVAPSALFRAVGPWKRAERWMGPHCA